MGREEFTSLPLIRFRLVWAGMFLMIAIPLVVAVSGCGRSGTDEEPSSGEAPEYPSTLSAQSSPEDVARVLIRALDEGDKATLLGLVAAKAATGDIEAIYRRYGRTSNTRPEAVAGLAAAGWRASYAFLQTGQTQIKREEVQGDAAAVFVTGKSRDGRTATLKISLVREDGLWKVKPGLESVAK